MYDMVHMGYWIVLPYSTVRAYLILSSPRWGSSRNASDAPDPL